MARPVWTGIVSFGLVSLPVALYTATDSHTIRFHQLQRGTADRIRNRRVNERNGDEVHLDEIVKGYDTGSEYVIVEPKEVDDIAPGRSKALEVSEFVDLDAVWNQSSSTRRTTSGHGASSTARYRPCSSGPWRSRTKQASQPS
ncbi:Ku protein [Streptomyces sp. NPDC102437]|uniref:Ku protein n=1 Tax=Streptomyces sp. NPDC102437 TaxID=3366175 RepID=UPI0038228DF7